MKVNLVTLEEPGKFKPIRIELEIETYDDFRSLYCALNVSDNSIHKDNTKDCSRYRKFMQAGKYNFSANELFSLLFNHAIAHDL